MLSILIPTYNYNVYSLVKDIEKQTRNANIIYELICIDDGSNSSINMENEKINNLKNCKFIASFENLGLSNNRNNLVQASKYEYLLFIDGDSLLIDDNYINNYIKAIKENTDVIYGGRKHPKHVEVNRKLRWKYGKYIEDLSVSSRQQNIYKCVLFNNTLIKKHVFNKIGFEKSITNYGYEDAVFAFNLSKIKASVLHINNPVLHGDVDINDIFFLKHLNH